MAEKGLEIGIVIAAYNSEKTIERAVESVLHQTNPSWKLMIVDDGSTDGTLAIAQRYAESDSRIRCIHQENAGTSKARAVGYEAIETDQLAFLDADDELRLDYIESMSNLVRSNPGYAFYACNIRFCFPKFNRVEWKYKKPTKVDLAQWGESPDIALSGAVVQRGFYELVGGFGEYLSYVEDFYLLVRLLLVGDAIINPEPLYIYYRQFRKQKSSHKLKIWKSCIWALEYIKETVELTPEQEKILDDRIRLFRKFRRNFIYDSSRHIWHIGKAHLRNVLMRGRLIKR